MSVCFSRTCGQGLAENAALPAKLGEMIGALAENLELHMKALDPKDKNAEKFVKVEQELRAMLEKRVEQGRSMLAAMGGR